MAQPELPVPTGEYKVGTTTFSVTDSSRVETLGPNPGTSKRRIRGRFYYPVLPKDAEGLSKAVVISDKLGEGLRRMYHAKADTPSYGDYYLDASPAPGKFPLIIYSHGTGSYAEANHFLCCELCSHGYNVLAVGHAFESVANEYDDGSCDFMDKSLTKPYQPYFSGVVTLSKILLDKKSDEKKLYEKMTAFQEKYGSILLDRLEQRAKDIDYILGETLQRFGSRIDTDKGFGITGHSMGGLTAYYMCQYDDRFAAGINLDGLVVGNYEGMTMRKPFYQISCNDNIKVQTKVVLNSEAPIYWEVFRNMKHHGFCDLKFFIPISMIVGKMPPMVMHENSCRIHKTFFDMYVKGIDCDVWYPSDDNLKRIA